MTASPGDAGPELRRVGERDGGPTLAIPADWEELPTDGEGTLVVAREPAGASGSPGSPGAEPGFRANLVFTAVPNGGLSFRDWQAGTDELLPRTLTDYQLIDLEKLEFAGHPGGRRLAHHALDEAGALTMEQWFTQVADVGYTLTATVPTWRYDELAEPLAAIAASVELREGG